MTSSTYPYSFSCSTDHLGMNFLPDCHCIFLIELNNTAQRGISLSTENTEHCTTARGTGFDVDVVWGEVNDGLARPGVLL